MERLFFSLKETLRSRLSESSYKVWITPLTYGGFDGDTLSINCPNQFFASWIQEHYLPLLKDDLTENGRSLKVRLCPAEIAKEAARSQLHLPKFAPNELPRPRFCERFTFDEFVVGDHNRYAHGACWATANEQSNYSKVIYLQANAGLGKTHLAQAVGQHILTRKPRTQLCYLNANEFTTQVIRAIQNDRLDSFMNYYQKRCDVLLLEEVHSFSGRKRTQSELASALDILLENGKTVIFTGNRLPREIPKVDDQLRSRLGSGLITAINPPDFAARKKIILRKAKNQGVDLEEHIAEFLAERLEGDIRTIEGAVIGLVAKSSLMKRPVDAELAREVMQDIVGEAPYVTVEDIRALICRHFGLTKGEIRSKSRKRAVAWPRQVAMYLARKHTDATLESIGREFNRDHATVQHSVKRIAGEMEKCTKARSQIDYLVTQMEKQRWDK